MKITINDEHLIIVGIYHLPGSNIESFISSLELVLLNDFVRNKNVISGGDMSINQSFINSTHVMKYISLFDSYMFMPAITKSTRFPGGDLSRNPSTLDHIFLKRRTNFQSGIIYCDISDHCPTFLMQK